VTAGPGSSEFLLLTQPLRWYDDLRQEHYRERQENSTTTHISTRMGIFSFRFFYLGGCTCFSAPYLLWFALSFIAILDRKCVCSQCRMVYMWFKSRWTGSWKSRWFHRSALHLSSLSLVTLGSWSLTPSPHHHLYKCTLFTSAHGLISFTYSGVSMSPAICLSLVSRPSTVSPFPPLFICLVTHGFNYHPHPLLFSIKLTVHLTSSSPDFAFHNTCNVPEIIVSLN